MLDGMPTSETLESTEVAAITGRKRPREQREWLDRNGWAHRLTAAGHPVVGRVYARLMLAGINPAKQKPAQGWSLDVSKVT